MNKEANPDHPVHELITQRWSPYAFADRQIERDDLLSLFEAARWAASSYNEQPWSFIIATKDQTEQFDRIVSCLVEANQAWAKNAPVLALTVASLKFQRNGKPNAAAVHDTGLAAGNLTFEATARGLSVHQMIGILPEKARIEFKIPEGHEAKTALAIGYVGDADSLPDSLRQRDQAERERKPLNEFVFTGKFGDAADFVS